MKVWITLRFSIILHQIIVYLKYNIVLIQTTQLFVIITCKMLKVSQPKDTLLVWLRQGRGSIDSPPSPPSFCVCGNHDCCWSCTPSLNELTAWFSEGKERRKERLAIFTALHNQHYYYFILFSYQDYDDSYTLLDPIITWGLLVFLLVLHMKYRKSHHKKKVWGAFVQCTGFLK